MSIYVQQYSSLGPNEKPRPETPEERLTRLTARVVEERRKLKSMRQRMETAETEAAILAQGLPAQAEAAREAEADLARCLAGLGGGA